jgi:hypothetical protein
MFVSSLILYLVNEEISLSRLPETKLPHVRIVTMPDSEFKIGPAVVAAFVMTECGRRLAMVANELRNRTMRLGPVISRTFYRCVANHVLTPCRVLDERDLNRKLAVRNTLLKDCC